jgi:hypothetical protein
MKRKQPPWLFNETSYGNGTGAGDRGAGINLTSASENPPGIVDDRQPVSHEHLMGIDGARVVSLLYSLAGPG